MGSFNWFQEFLKDYTVNSTVFGRTIKANSVANDGSAILTTSSTTGPGRALKIYIENPIPLSPADEARIANLENNEYKVTYFASIGAATGAITVPTGGTILLDQFYGGVDAYVSTIVNGQPTGVFPKTAGGVTVDVSSFAAMGTYVLTGVPSAFPVALIYKLKIKALNWANLTTANILDMQEADVVSTDNAITRFDGTKGNLQNSVITIDDNGKITTPGVTTSTFTAKSIEYDNTLNQWIMYDNDSATAMNVGYETWFICLNNTGVSIPNGSCVYVSGASGGIPTIALAKADVGTTSVGIGITTEAIANGGTGKVTQSGLVNGVDTSALSPGAVYVSATTAGGLTNTAPVSPNYRMRVGFVGAMNAVTGTILVTPSTAALGNGTANQILAINAAGTAQQFRSAVDLKIPQTFSAVTPYSSVTTATDEVACSILIPAGTIAAGDQLRLDGISQINSSVNNKTMKWWLSATPGVQGSAVPGAASQLALTGPTTTGAQGLSLQRRFAVRSLTSIIGWLDGTTTFGLDGSTTNVANTAITVPTFASNTYLIATVNRVNGADLARFDYLFGIVFKA